MKHFSEAELLETYYLQPGESMPVMMHLAVCDGCAGKYERLERKLREAAACPTKPETFWHRQRLSIMRRIASARPARIGRLGAAARIVAAATLAFVLGGAIVYRQTKPLSLPAEPVNAHAVAKAPNVDDMHALINPWESDELKEFHGVVQWESWVEQNGGGGSL